MKPKACIFDLDGVIVDTAKYHYLAWKRLANELGFEFTEKDNERLKGVSRMESLEILLSIGGVRIEDENTKLQLAEKKNKWYVEYINQITREEILPGVMEFLGLLKNAGIKIAIGSASKNTITILERIGLKDFFDAIIDGTKISKAKPDPEIFLKAAEEMDVRPEECCVFEDAVAGIQAAKSAGMKVIGVGDPMILKDADKVIQSFQGQTLELIEF
ncbi:beta-phosphoglucomutase [Fervidobacterium pennivorans subsp. shakshaketiis]|uniref:Beta-phosphoglucomutase n=1 Tax=Fervidobacterium pennivorans (strain DSM 9078 / Ven5) TaxID=771875 RepID=H9UDR4_FERPD|nr:beta-phosphoglucomutase [Fervidobacterium pennivorans]AFG35657.1 beta-phosphoglucomutase [Fervidobacterium pennivorans DSM 9078]QIV78735.1 beta-phosphoglucomutase [Fervidobacterium pennivorans subsp. keratinolyticus]